MRKQVRNAAAVAALTLAGSLTVVAPAHADHVADIFFDRQECRLGAMQSGIGIDLWTSDYKVVRDRSGNVLRYHCFFSDVPRSADTGEFGEMSYPQRAYRGHVECWDSDLPTAIGHGSFVITPSGRGVLRCDFR